MITDRRNFLALMAAGALGTLYGAPTKNASRGWQQNTTTAAPTYTCILLHGLFFMQFKNHLLTVTTPIFKPHTIGSRPQGTNNIKLIPAGTAIDWTNVGLKDNGSSTETFPPSIMQFSASQTGSGELLPAGKKNYHLKLTLNRPFDIHPFRHQGKLGDFGKVAKQKSPKANGKDHIRDNVIKSCGSVPNNPISLLVGLVYERDASSTLPGVISFHAEHQMNCNQIGATQVNPALVKAQDLFANPKDFDLEFQDVGGIASVCPDDIGAYGVAMNDEFSACELLVGQCIQFAGPNPINCAQFGVNG
ncbi:MAG TPA: hypothetical protein VKV30_01545 [Candidatus Angelobacter sp.]|nr:hypothetical protein [Candidatus Angelobacter sp.]